MGWSAEAEGFLTPSPREGQPPLHGGGRDAGAGAGGGAGGGAGDDGPGEAWDILQLSSSELSPQSLS